jgi:hypothetical protein
VGYAGRAKGKRTRRKWQRAIKGRAALTRGPTGGAGRGCVTGAETGAARSGPTRARPEEEDDRRVPTCRRDKEEGGDAGCSGP